MNPIEPTVGVSTDASHDDATLAGEGAPVRSMSGSGPRWPARLGRYVMLQELGQGGMGVVCAAYDQELDRKVAIKLLHGQGDEQALVRLVREAQALARLSHPNVVQIYEIGEFEQLRFLVMEFVDGVTLREWLRSEPRSQAEILAVFDGAGRGLAAAHAEGLVHRDFKPDNVMIHRDGRALVMDFGLARAGTGRSPASHQLSEPTLTQDSLGAAGSMTSGSLGNQLSVELTRTGSLLGTPAYMAPEQFRGLETDAKTDQFAFCVASWEALTGARPFVGDNLAALSLAVTTGTITATAATAGLPSWIRNHLERGLASDPALRWPTMDALLAALRDDPTRRRRGGFAALGVGVAGLALALGLTLASERERVATLSSCEAEGQAIQAEWTDAERTTIEAAFVASDLPMAADTWARAQLAMATYAQAWTELRTEACIETRIEHERDPSEYAALADCLDQHRTVFATLIETWHAPTRRQIAGAASAARNLPPLSACSDPALLAARVELPKTPDARARVAMLRHRLDRAKALRLAFDYAAGLAEAEIALAEAEAFGWPPIVAEARLVVARLHESLGHYDLAQTAMTQAFTEAGAAGDDLLALDAATSLIFLVGHRLGRPESGLVWSEISAMLIGRLGLAGTLQEASWFNLVGVLRDDLGEYPVALDDYGRALAIRETLLGPNNLTVAFSLFNLGATHSTLGHLHDARAR